ncbi:uncharacterized protein [Henckelia pumila]|uniref:uncharacterized protein n=1 Tax=Henckelia pumila TaxID=405737 RepID=UPI003C6E4F97
MENKAAHVLVFPYPAQGHMLPLLDLTHQLSLRNLNLTVLITPANLPILTPLLSANPSIETLILPFPNSPLIPQGVENIKDLGNQGNIPMISALSRLQEPIIQWFHSHSDPPVAILSDFFLGWTNELAHQLKIRRIAFFCSGAILAAASDHLWENCEALKAGFEVKFRDLPGSPSLTWDEVPSLFRRYKESQVNDPTYELVKESIMANTSSWGLVFNSLVDLEDEFLDYLSEKMSHPRVYTVGPLHLLGRPNNLGGGPPIASDVVLSWLDECDDGSVLYVCFGSQKLLEKAQMEALASGLERSGVKFVWAVKQPTAQQVADGFGSVPDGFEDWVAGRGFIIKGWAPQSAILSHPAVGGFLSHCGWNSVLEAVASGVMILGWPMEADQFLNDKLMVDYKGAAVRVCKGSDTVPDPDELARKIFESMRGDVVERIRAKELRDKAVEAVKAGGSSNKDLDGLVQLVAKLKLKDARTYFHAIKFSRNRRINFRHSTLNFHRIMEKKASSKIGAHVLVFPYPAQGHMLPLLDLTHQLSLRNLSLTVLITPGNLPILTPLLSANPSIQTLILPFPNSPLIPPGVENIKELGDRGNIPMASALRKLEEPIIQWFESHSDPPVAILSDFFLGWTHHLACKLNIERVAFYTSGAILASILDRLWEDPEALKPGFEVKFQGLPGSPCLAWEELPSLFRIYKELEVPDPSFGEFIKSTTVDNTSSWAVVFNSLVALEGNFLDYLTEKLGNPRVYSVGPLHLLGLPKSGPISGGGGGVLSWLDDCEDGSVLYVCFGSQKFLNKAQIEALASGLERSGVKFVWAVKQVTAQQVADGFGSVSDGFQDRVAGRGFVIEGWAPQTAILSHRAVGGFLSHCGWNSLLEAVASGVMMLCWPMEADQYLDDLLMVDYKKAAVQVCKGSDTVPDPDELARKITELMSGEVVERIRAKELRDKVMEAVKVGGSSNKNLDLLVQELAKL